MAETLSSSIMISSLDDGTVLNSWKMDGFVTALTTYVDTDANGMATARVVTGGFNGSLRIWLTDGKLLLRHVAAADRKISLIAAYKDLNSTVNSTFVAVGHSYGLSAFVVGRGTLHALWTRHIKGYMRARVSTLEVYNVQTSDMLWIVAGCTDGAVRVLSAADGKELLTRSIYHRKIVSMAVFTEDLPISNSTLTVTTLHADGTVMVSSPGAISRTWEVYAKRRIRPYVTDLSAYLFSEDVMSMRLVVGWSDGMIDVYSVADRKVLRRWRGHRPNSLYYFESFFNYWVHSNGNLTGSSYRYEAIAIPRDFIRVRVAANDPTRIISYFYHDNTLKIWAAP